MPTLYIVRALPAAGKSTLFKEHYSKVLNTFRVERDCIREMLFGKLWTGKAKDEELVTKIQTQSIRNILQSGFNCVSTDTNLNPETLGKLKSLAAECNAKVVIDDSLLSVSVEECIRRDLIRPNSVGEKVIRNFAAKYLPQPEKIEQNKSLPKAAIFDLDGTTFLNTSGRSAYDWSRVAEDEPNPHIISIIKALKKEGYAILFVSGRDSICRSDSITAIERATGLSYENVEFELLMRAYKDNRRDSIIKKEIYERDIKDRFYVEMVYDDRAQVNRECWKLLGLNVLRCGIIDEDEF